MKLKSGAVYVSGSIHIQDFQEIASIATGMVGTDNLELETEIAGHYGVTFIAAPPTVLVRLRQEYLRSQ